MEDIRGQISAKVEQLNDNVHIFLFLKRHSKLNQLNPEIIEQIKILHQCVLVLTCFNRMFFFFFFVQLFSLLTQSNSSHANQKAVLSD
jgi:hypothetical protein